MFDSIAPVHANLWTQLAAENTFLGLAPNQIFEGMKNKLHRDF